MIEPGRIRYHVGPHDDDLPVLIPDADLLTQRTSTAPAWVPERVHRYRFSRAWAFVPLVALVAVVRFAPADAPPTPRGCTPAGPSVAARCW